jgi:predicted unusual protein kinase regulating ubiquinone biosynthesis (AarF/ABC1/UbiB family)
VFWFVTLGILLALVAIGFLIGRGHLPSGALSASWLGAKLRRIFASRAGRNRIDVAQRAAAAKRVAETMGSMKGAFMKLGQMMSFISDSVPEQFRAQLKQLQSDAPPMDFPLVRDTVERCA